MNKLLLSSVLGLSLLTVGCNSGNTVQSSTTQSVPTQSVPTQSKTITVDVSDGIVVLHTRTLQCQSSVYNTFDRQPEYRGDKVNKTGTKKTVNCYMNGSFTNFAGVTFTKRSLTVSVYTTTWDLNGNVLTQGWATDKDSNTVDGIMFNYVKNNPGAVQRAFNVNVKAPNLEIKPFWYQANYGPLVS